MADDGLHIGFYDAWLVEGVRTAFADLNGPLSPNSPTDLGIKVARAVFERSGLPASDVGIVVGGSMAQAAFDAYLLPRHIGLYAGVPRAVAAHLVQRVCGTGIELIIQAADAVSLGRADLALGVGTESMSRNPVAAYTHRDGFRMGQIEFKDFLWESLLDTACGFSMGHTAENLAARYKLSREEVDAFAARSFERALAAQASGFLAGEIVPVTNETFECEGLKPRAIRVKGKDKEVAVDTHVRPSSIESLAKIRPAFGGVQTGGNSSGVVDGAAAVLVANGSYLESKGKKPLARILGGVSIGVDPSIMGIGPVPAIKMLLQRHQLSLPEIGRFEINEAFSAQCLACARELDLDENRLNVNGGATAIGHPLGATGVRLTYTLARELRRSGERYGIASACIGGGQGIALLIENAGSF
jgi:acetyl-CoA C-acetyltransferase